jgi:hypothetical protein
MVAAGGVRRLPVEQTAPEGDSLWAVTHSGLFCLPGGVSGSENAHIDNQRRRTSYFSEDLKSRCERLAVGPDWP